jgi:hypothetical protein
MQADTHPPPERRADEGCAVPDDERGIGPKSGVRFWERYRRLLWFVLLYVASLAVFAALVYGFKLIIPR